MAAGFHGSFFLGKRFGVKDGGLIFLPQIFYQLFMRDGFVEIEHQSGHERVRGHFKLLELVEKRPGQWQQTLEFTVEIEGEEKPALQAEWISQFFV